MRPDEVMRRLRDDHAQLRDALEALERAFFRARDRHGVREACHDLSRTLKEHVAREGRVAVACGRVMGAFGSDTLARFAVEHYTDQQYLDVITRCVGRSSAPLEIEAIRFAATGLLTGLRQHMVEQEADLFPFMEEVLAAAPAAHPAAVEERRPAFGVGRLLPA
jgi:hypothetical protein